MAERPNNFFAENIFTRPPITPIGGTGGGIEIPGIRVGAVQSGVMGTLEFYQTDTWKSLNPRIFLFTPKRRRRKQNNPGDPDYVSPRPSRMVHPTHLAGSNVKWWGGMPRFGGAFGQDGNALILRHTEFVLPTTVPYSWFNLNNLGLDPYEWCNYVNLMDGTKRQTTSADFPVPASNVGANNGGDPFYVQMANSIKNDGAYSGFLGIQFSNQKKKFKFAIVIDNPNATANSPYLIGPMSDSVVLRFAHETGGTGMFNLSITPDHISKVIT